MSEIIKRLKKIARLASDGVGGEQENAELLLNKLLEKYDLQLEEVAHEERSERWYKYTNHESRIILVQIILKVLNKKSTKSYRKQRAIIAHTTDIEHMHILELYEFHWAQYRKEKKQILEDLMDAYLDKHSLYPDLPAEFESNGSFDPIDIERVQRISAMVDGMADVDFKKKISE